MGEHEHVAIMFASCDHQEDENCQAEVCLRYTMEILHLNDVRHYNPKLMNSQLLMYTEPISPSFRTCRGSYRETYARTSAKTQIRKDNTQEDGRNGTIKRHERRNGVLQYRSIQSPSRQS